MLLRLLPFILILASSAAIAESPVCVTVPRVILRSEPNSKATTTWVVTKNMPFMRLEKKGKWTHVEDVDGEKHWLPSNAVSGRVPCAVIRVKTARLRRAPSSNAPLAEIPLADKYTAFRRVGGEDEFVELVDDFGEHYFANDNSIWYPVTKMQINF